MVVASFFLIPSMIDDVVSLSEVKSKYFEVLKLIMDVTKENVKSPIY